MPTSGVPTQQGSGAGGRRLRTIDLARLAGISAQQIRNYVELGVLPAVNRAPSGYRIFTDDHVEALHVARRMAEGHGWRLTHAIMRAVHEGDVESTLALLDQSHAELHADRVGITNVLKALETVVAEPDRATAGTEAMTAAHTVGTGGAAAPVTGPHRGRHIGEVAGIVGVRTSSLRLWEQYGLLRPAREKITGYRVYDEPEVRRAHVVALLRRGGYPFPIVHAVLDEMRSTANPERVRAELAKREQELHRRSLRRLRASAALHGYLQRRGPAGSEVEAGPDME